VSTEHLIELAAGEVLAIEADQVVTLTRGSVEVWSDNRLLDIAEPQQWFGLARALSGETTPMVSLRARTTASLSRWLAADMLDMLQAEPARLTRLSVALARECVRHEREADAALRRADDFFLPGAELYPPKYTFGPFPSIALVIEHEPEQLAARLPPGLVPLPGASGRCLVMINDIARVRCEHVPGREWAYREVVPFIPVVCPSRMAAGLYTPEVFADATMPILLGREVYGFPKRLGRIRIEDHFVRLLVDHALALELRWTSKREISEDVAISMMASALLPGAPARLIGAATSLFGALDLSLDSLPTRAFMRKRIHDPRGRAGVTWAIDELVEVPFTIDALASPMSLRDVDLELGRSWPLGPGKLIAAVACDVGFHLANARRVRDYVRGRDV
jgi:Acetoacetate decarboxylase (ADC)